MNRYTKLALFFLILCILLYCASYFFRLPFLRVSPFVAVPNASALVIDVRDVVSDKHAFRKMLVAERNTPNFMHTMASEFAALDTAFMQGKQQLPSELLLVPHIFDEQKVTYLSILSYTQYIDIQSFIQYLKPERVFKNIFDQHNIYQLHLKGGKEVTLSSYRNLLLVSKFSYQVEDAIQQIHNTYSSVTNDRQFRKIKNRVSKKESVHVFVHASNLPILLAPIIHPDKRPQVDFLQNLGWFGGRFSLAKGKPQFAGLFEPDSDNYLMQSIVKQSNKYNLNFASVLPDNVAFSLIFDCSAGSLLEKIFKEDNPFKKFVYPWIENQAAFVITEPTSTNFDGNKFLVFKSKNIASSEKMLQQWAVEMGEIAVTNHQTYTIKRIMVNDAFAPLLGSGFNDIHNPYFTIIDDFVIFANELSSLQLWIDKYIIQKTLSNSNSFLQLAKQSAPKAPLYAYLNTNALHLFAKAYLKPTVADSLLANLGFYQQINTFALQLKKVNNSLIFNTFNNKTPSNEHQTSIAWRIQLAAPLAQAPSILQRASDGEHFLVAQDTSHFLYLVDKSGTLRWKKKLEGPLLSKVYGIDYFGDGTLQMLYNTREQIHLLDLEGNEVGIYPITLQSKATNGLLCVDFYNRKEYPYFLACENKNIYGFWKDGRPVGGWNPQMNVGLVKTPLQHFFAQKEDYLMAVSDKNIQFFKQKGIKMDKAIALPNAYFGQVKADLLHPNFKRVMLGNGTEKLKIINLQGQSFNLAVAKSPSKNLKFELLEMGGDERKEIAVINNKELTLFAYNAKNEFVALWNKQLPEAQLDVFLVKVGEKTLLGTCAEHNRIYLFDEKGNLFNKDFPLAGTMPFEVLNFFNDGKEAILAANKDVLYAYKLE